MFKPSTPYGEINSWDMDSMIRKSIKLLFIKIRVPAVTLQDVDRSTMSSASIQSQSPRSSVNNLSCQPRLSRMPIGRPCRLRQSRVKAHDLLLIKFQLQVLKLNLVYQLSDHLFINDPNLVSAWLNPWFQLSVVRKPRQLRTIKTQALIRSLQLAIETPQRTIWFRQGTNRLQT